MKIREIKNLLEQGRYSDVFLAIESLDGEEAFAGLCYKALILCLRGDILEAIPLVDQLWELCISSEDKSARFTVLALKTCLYGWQGKQLEVHQSFSEGQKLMNSLEEQEREKVKEWEVWLNFGLGIFYQNSEMFDRPFVSNLHSSLEIIDSLPGKGGKEWILRHLYLYYLMINQSGTALEYLAQLKELVAGRRHVFGQAFVSLLEGGILWFMGDLEKSLELLNQSLPVFIKHGLHVLIVGVFNAFSMIYHREGDYDKVISYAKKSIQLMEKKGFYWPYPWKMAIEYYTDRSEYQTALRYTKQLLAICEENHNQVLVVQRLQHIAYIYYHKGDFSEALNWVQQSIEQSEAMKDIQGQIVGLDMMGNITYQQGNLDQAIDFYQQALTFAKEIRYEIGGQGSSTSFLQAKLARIYSLKGDYDQALDLLQTALSKVKNYELGWFEGTDFHLQIGMILMKKGDYKQARNQLKISLADCEKYRSPQLLASTLYSLVLTCSELDAIDEAREYLQRLEQIGKEAGNRRINQLVQISRGIIFKKSPRAALKVKAQEIFQQITEEEHLDHELTVFAILNLLEILTWELSSTGHEEVLQEIQQLLTRLNEIARKEKSLTLEIEVALIQSQIELITDRISEAMAILKDAEVMAREKKFENHRIRIEHQQQLIEKELNKWSALTEQNASLIERMKESELMDYIVKARRYLDKGTNQEDKKEAFLKIN